MTVKIPWVSKTAISDWPKSGFFPADWSRRPGRPAKEWKVKFVFERTPSPRCSPPTRGCSPTEARIVRTSLEPQAFKREKKNFFVEANKGGGEGISVFKFLKNVDKNYNLCYPKWSLNRIDQKSTISPLWIFNHFASTLKAIWGNKINF